MVVIGGKITIVSGHTTGKYPAWTKGSVTITNEADPAINSRLNYAARLSYAPNNRDLILTNTQVGDGGTYTSTITGPGGIDTVVPEPKRFPSDATIQLNSSNKVQIVIDGIAPFNSHIQVKINNVIAAGKTVYGSTATNGLYTATWTSTEDAVQGSALPYIISVDVGAGLTTVVSKTIALRTALVLAGVAVGVAGGVDVLDMKF